LPAGGVVLVERGWRKAGDVEVEAARECAAVDRSTGGLGVFVDRTHGRLEGLPRPMRSRELCTAIEPGLKGGLFLRCQLFARGHRFDAVTAAGDGLEEDGFDVAAGIEFERGKGILPVAGAAAAGKNFACFVFGGCEEREEGDDGQHASKFTEVVRRKCR